MNKLTINETAYTPNVILDATESSITFSGISRPENAGLFYHQILNWIYDLQPVIEKRKLAEFKLTFKLDYCNSPSQKYFILIIEKLLDYNLSLTIDWYSDMGDEKMLEDGEDIADALGINFNFKELC